MSGWTLGGQGVTCTNACVALGKVCVAADHQAAYRADADTTSGAKAVLDSICSGTTACASSCSTSNTCGMGLCASSDEGSRPTVKKNGDYCRTRVCALMLRPTPPATPLLSPRHFSHRRLTS